MEADMEYCKKNKPKLYRETEKGRLRHMPGVDEPWEKPENAVMALDPGKPGSNTERIIEYLAEKKIFPLN